LEGILDSDGAVEGKTVVEGANEREGFVDGAFEDVGAWESEGFKLGENEGNELGSREVVGKPLGCVERLAITEGRVDTDGSLLTEGLVDTDGSSVGTIVKLGLLLTEGLNDMVGSSVGEGDTEGRLVLSDAWLVTSAEGLV
jgi:hypothetical protein